MEFCTSSVWLNLVLFVAGLWILIKGSDLFIDSAADIARQYHVSELVIGLTLVSIGTSLPEFASSLYASFCDQPEFIVGNIVGSITTNITLILGAAALVGGAMPFPRKLLVRDGFFMMATFLVTTAMTYLCDLPGPGLNRFCGGILFAGAIGYCVWLFRSSDEQHVQEAEAAESEAVSRATGGIVRAYCVLALGLGMVLLGSKILLDTVVWGAMELGVSTMVISVTVVAFGTSVPELAVTIAGVKKNRHELAIGNIIGSCTFNILMIFGACALVRPLRIEGWVGGVNLAVMCLSGAVLLISMRGKELNRRHGAALLTIYTVFLIYNCRSLLLPLLP